MMDQSWPLIEVAVEPRRRSDGDRLLSALAARAAEDPSIRVVHDPESGQTMLGGWSEVRLEVELSALRRQHDFSAGAPQVAYRETVTCRVEREHTHRAAAGSPSRFARLMIAVEPSPPGTGLQFTSPSAVGEMPVTYVPAVRGGVAAALRAGVLEGRPVVDVRVTLVDVAYHDLDSDAPTFHAAALAAARAALVAAGPVLLEPVMAVEVRTPVGGAVVADDLRIRGGDVRTRPLQGGIEAVGALVPLAGMLGFAGRLRALTEGKAWFETLLDHHRPVRAPGGEPPPAAAAALRA